MKKYLLNNKTAKIIRIGNVSLNIGINSLNSDQVKFLLSQKHNFKKFFEDVYDKKEKEKKIRGPILEWVDGFMPVLNEDLDESGVILESKIETTISKLEEETKESQTVLSAYSDSISEYQFKKLLEETFSLELLNEFFEITKIEKRKKMIQKRITEVLPSEKEIKQ